MNVHDLEMGQRYRITADDKRKNRVGKAIGLELYGDVRTFIDAHTGGRAGYIEGWKTPEWVIPHNSLHDCVRDAMQMFECKQVT